jgi:predicted DNA-binding protein
MLAIVIYSYFMKKSDLMTIRVPKELKVKVKSEAERQRRTMANQVVFLIERGIEVLEAGEKPA